MGMNDGIHSFIYVGIRSQYVVFKFYFNILYPSLVNCLHIIGRSEILLLRVGCWSMEQIGSKIHWLWKYQWFQEQIRRNPEEKDRLLHGLALPSLMASPDQGNSDLGVAAPGKW